MVTPLLIAVVLLLWSGPVPAQDTEIAVGSTRFQVELARTPQERRRGLMFREQLPEGHGMLFVQPEPAPARFWMKNTYIPLDLLYFDDSGELLEIMADVPPCTTPLCPTYDVSVPVKYILEINAGSAAELGLVRGDRLQLDGAFPSGS
jgi:uncharacterized membrane protein (UPF0127 family)